MKTLIQILCISLALFLALNPLSLSAQTFTPIIGDYECGQFPNGSEFLVRRTDTGFELVKSADVKAAYLKERRVIKQRLAIINELLSGFKASRIAKAKMIGGANKVLAKLFGDDSIPNDLAPSEAEARVQGVKQRILDRDRLVQTISGLITDCGNGLTVKKGKGSPIGVTVKAVSIASSREIFGGFLIYSSKIKNQYSRVPTGYNVCLKLIFSDGSISRLYTGFGDEGLCGTGTLKFEGVAPNVCDALLPAGQAGYVIPQRSYAFTSLPNATTEQLLDQIRLETLQEQPLVGVMYFPVTLSRDASVKACEGF